MKSHSCLRSTIIYLIIVFFISIFACSLCKGQEALKRYPNTVYATVQTPPGMALGARVDFEFTRYGIYSSILHNNYEFDTGEYIRDHTRIAVGGYFPLEIALDNDKGIYNNTSIGLVYHRYGKRNFNTASKAVFYPVSIEMGMGSKINRFAFSLNLDLIKWESIIGVGYNF